MPKQYKIDSVSNLYPAMGGYVFRLCAVLRKDVDAALLRRAVRHVAPQFPIMCSHLERTFMSYVHVAATDLDVVSYGEPPIRNPDMFDTKSRASACMCGASGLLWTCSTVMPTVLRRSRF